MYSQTETKEMRSAIALELARHMMMVKVASGRHPYLDDEELNELFVVAGLPLLEPGELDEELRLINIDKEAEDENN